jgi:hypothetical protein
MTSPPSSYPENDVDDDEQPPSDKKNLRFESIPRQLNIGVGIQHHFETQSVVTMATMFTATPTSATAARVEIGRVAVNDQSKIPIVAINKIATTRSQRSSLLNKHLIFVGVIIIFVAFLVGTTAVTFARAMRKSSSEKQHPPIKDEDENSIGLVHDKGVCDDHDDCRSGSCAMFGTEKACCPDGLTFEAGNNSADAENNEAVYCASNLPLGAPCRLLSLGGSTNTNNDTNHVYGTLMNHPPFYYECQLGLACVNGTCQATPSLLAERQACHHDSDCTSAADESTTATHPKNRNDFVCAMASFSAKNKMCCPYSYTITSKNNIPDDDILTLCHGQAQAGETCGTHHALCESGVCTKGLCQAVKTGEGTTTKLLTIGPIQIYDYGHCERSEDCQSRTCALGSVRHLSASASSGGFVVPQKICCPRGMGTFVVVEEYERAETATTASAEETTTFCRHAGSIGTVCLNHQYAQLCSSQLCVDGICT